MQIIVFQYDFDAAIFVAGMGDFIPSATLEQAKSRAKELWTMLEGGQPKQIFIRSDQSKQLFYFDNFDKFNFYRLDDAKTDTNAAPVLSGDPQ